LDLKICHLYPDLMNLYGDRGNVLVLQSRCRWRSIDVSISYVRRGDPFFPAEWDLVFMGGGQDRQQRVISDDLQKKREALISAAEMGVVMLVICGGYQLFGHTYENSEGKRFEGLGIFDVHTVADEERITGNVVIKSSQLNPQTVVGFENHSGRTFLGKNASPFGSVITGHGNNGEDSTEGCVYRNVFGSYLHGPLLPKNPHLADLLIQRALGRRHGDVRLRTLDDELEWSAHYTQQH